MAGDFAAQVVAGVLNDVAVEQSRGQRELLISVVIPLFNEAATLPRLVARLAELKLPAGCSPQFVFVDDGSVDETLPALADCRTALKCWKTVSLTRNFGMQAACRAGIAHSDGDAIAVLDADLQDPPELVPEMVARWRSGASLVIGVRRSRPERGLRGMLLRVFHHIFARVTDNLMPRDSGNFALMDASVAARLTTLGESNYFLPALRVWAAESVVCLPYDREGREGKPRQTLSRLIAYAWDGITSFSDRPLRYISALGFLIAVPSFIYGMVLLVQRLLQFFGLFKDLEVLGFTTVAVAVFFMGGVQLICLGVIGEYVARTYRESKRRPAYFVSEISSSEDGRERS